MGQLHCYKLAKEETICRYAIDTCQYDYCPPPVIKVESAIFNGQGKYRDECQDDICILENFINECHFFAVFDGFGKYGKRAADYANHALQFYLQLNRSKIERAKNPREIELYLQGGITYVDSQLKKSSLDFDYSGVSLTGVLIERNQIYVMTIGNPKAYLVRGNEEQNKIMEISSQHILDNDKERERILSCGGTIVKFNNGNLIQEGKRFYIDKEGPGLVSTTAIGAWKYKRSLISTPEIKRYDFTVDDKFIVLGTDGLWDVYSQDEIAEFVFSRSQSKENKAEKLAARAQDRWLKRTQFIGIGDDAKATLGVDDIGIIIIYLNFPHK